MVRKAVRRWVEAAQGAGLDFIGLRDFVVGFPSVVGDLRRFRSVEMKSVSASHFPLIQKRLLAADKAAQAGVASGHYFHQDLLVARDIFEAKPRRHIDVGSSIYGFVSHVAAFREIEVLDVRPLSTTVPGIIFRRQDVLSIDREFYESSDSLSCLHALEHFGLGRYGDVIDPDGWAEGLRSLFQILEPGGCLYLSVPTAQIQQTVFNAHRVFSLPYLRGALVSMFQVERLSVILDDGSVLFDVDPYSEAASDSFGMEYGCSVWTLRKPSAAGQIAPHVDQIVASGYAGH